MAYNTEELKERIIKTIKQENLLTIEETYTFSDISPGTLYSHFPKESKDLKDIKEALRNNKTRVKHSQKAKWYKSNNPTLQIALFKLCASGEELKRLSKSYTEVSGELDSKIKHELPKGLEDVIKTGFRKALKEQPPTEEDAGEDSS